MVDATITTSLIAISIEKGFTWKGCVEPLCDEPLCDDLGEVVQVVATSVDSAIAQLR